MRRLSMIAVVLSVGVLVGAAPASAAETQVFQSSFNGAGSTKGPFSAGGGGGAAGGIGEIAIDQVTGAVYVADAGPEVVDKFDLQGNPVDFSSLGTTTVPQVRSLSVAVDNSGTATQGDLYSTGEYTGIAGFKPDGSPLGGNFPFADPSGDCSVSVSPVTGNLWVGTLQASSVEYTSAGVATGRGLGSGSSYCKGALDAADNLYLGFFGAVRKFESATGYSEPVSPSPIPPSGYIAPTIAIDPINQDIYVDFGEQVDAFHPSNEPSQPFQILTGFLTSRGLAFDANGNLYVAEAGTFADRATAKVDIFKRQPPSAPVIQGETVTGVHSKSAELGGKIVTGGPDTSYRIEYGPSSSYGTTLPSVDLGANATPYLPRVKVERLAPNTTYHYRLVATNAEGTTYGPDRVFTTFPTPPNGTDSCPNALARKQTGAQALLDCRAYELVSAADTGGYEVESSLVPGQMPFAGYPDASGRVLYGVHAGAIPGPWHPTNHGVDPYLATRGANGWSTDYLGIPADINPAAGAFSSSLGEADPQLDTLAFAGSSLCKPCFRSGLETGIPVRLPSGQLVQGMAGSLDPGVPSARPEGKVARYFSADGKHLVFASKYAFEPGANDNTGDLTVYDRDLSTGTTQIASTKADGATLTGPGISELDISADGSRIVFAQKVSSDSAGNEYLHPYMHLGSSPNAVDLAPGSATGVLYDGMSADGSRVFFTSKDKLLPTDTDASADIYAADVDSAGDVTLSLVSAGNSSTCNPVSNSAGEHWNTVGATADCGAVAIGGGGGVAGQSGTVYFLSPEQLDGANGTLDQPNLYREAPGGSPSFVATLEPDNPLVLDSVKASAIRKAADFQVTPSGGNAVFVSALALSAAEGRGNVEVFRYDAPSDRVDCPSCDPTNADVPGDASLPSNGLALTDDGRVFFTTPLPLLLNDTDSRADVYEWSGGIQRLISAGTSPFDSVLLSVSADGIDAYFFTHDDLAPEEDQSGGLTRIYDARAGGGFFKLPTEVPCAASDECHGPGTSAPAPANIKSSGKTTDGNVLTCRKGRVKKRGQCVKAQAKKRHAKKAHVKKRHAHTKRKRGASHA
jgi:hypothetical protein